MTTLIVSACLLGYPCRYDGRARPSPEVRALAETAGLRCLPLCPELLARLPVPRPPAEIAGGDGHQVLDGCARVVNAAGQDLTGAFLTAADRTLRMVRIFRPGAAIMKESSPSCGKTCVYDGTFRGILRPGPGVTTAALLRRGVPVFTEEEIPALREQLALWR